MGFLFPANWPTDVTIVVLVYVLCGLLITIRMCMGRPRELKRLRSEARRTLELSQRRRRGAQEESAVRQGEVLYNARRYIRDDITYREAIALTPKDVEYLRPDLRTAVDLMHEAFKTEEEAKVARDKDRALLRLNIVTYQGYLFKKNWRNNIRQILKTGFICAGILYIAGAAAAYIITWKHEVTAAVSQDFRVTDTHPLTRSVTIEIDDCKAVFPVQVMWDNGQVVDYTLATGRLKNMDAIVLHGEGYVLPCRELFSK